MEAPFKGKLVQVPFPVIFAKITREKHSGVLSLADPKTKKIQKRIGFKGGTQAYVAGGTINETLGRLLLKWGKITEKQYSEILSAQKANNKRTGETLIQMGLLDGSQLAEALRKQTEEKILGCFAWPDGIYSFIEATPPKGKQLLFFQIQPEKIIMEGIRRYFNQQRIESAFRPWRTARFRRTPLFAEMSQKMALAPSEARVVHAFKDGFGVQEFLAVSPVDTLHTLQVVFTMLVLCMIEPVSTRQKSGAQAVPQQSGVKTPRKAPPAPPGPKHAEAPPSPPPRRGEEISSTQFAIEGEDAPEIARQEPAVTEAEKAPETKKPQLDAEEKKRRQEILAEIVNFEKIIKEGNFFDLLGVSREAKAAEIKKAFFHLAKKFHPDTNPAFFKGEFKERAEEIFTHIGEAYNTLIDERARQEYVYALDHNITQEDLDQAQRALEAEGIFVKAEILFKKGDFRGAQSLIEEAIQLNPDEPEYHVYLGWCQYKTTRGAAIEQARQSIQKAIDMGLREKIDMANYYLGMLAKVQKRPAAEQRRYFAAAVEANPHNTLAASELRRIDRHAEKEAPTKETPPKKKGGFFGRFRK